MRGIFQFIAIACVACAAVCSTAHGSTSGVNGEDVWRKYHMSSTFGRKDNADRLADAVVQWSTVSNRGGLTLHYAVEKGYYEVVRLLLSRGAPTNETDSGGRTPFHLALKLGRRNAATLLAGKSGLISTDTSTGRTTLHSAAANGYEDIARLLILAGAPANAFDRDGLTPFHIALKHGHFSIAELLFQRGANINTASRSGSTPLHEAAKQGNFMMVQLMVVRGVSLNARDEQRWTAYHLAMNGSHKDIVDLLHASGANIVTASTETTTLHTAVQTGYLDVVELLLSSGAYINARIGSGPTPFHQAILAKQKAIAEFLLTEGAHPRTSRYEWNYKTSNGDESTTLADAWKNGWGEICEVIRLSDKDIPPGYPPRTYDFFNCTWTIVAPGRSFTIRLSFENLDIITGSRSESQDCKLDHLAIFRGNIITNESLMHRYCGNISPDPIAVEAESLTLQYHKRYVAPAGFDIVYTIEAKGKPNNNTDTTASNGPENADIPPTTTTTSYIPKVTPIDAFERLDLWVFQQNKIQLELLLRSLHELQVADTSSPASFFAMAAVHGYPREAYNGISPPQGRAGFCEHRNALFPIWHRPYMLLFENAIRDAAAMVVSRYDEPLRAKYEAELPKLRLPFWDWAKRADIPSILKQPTVVVEGYKGGRERIANPLHSYMFQRTVATEDTWAVPSMEELASTKRHRDDMTQWQTTLNDYHQTIKDAWCNALHATEYGMLSINPRNEANAATVWSDNDAQLFTMERAHDLVHVITGGHGGHMAYVESAAFDPIFFLHHSNVDRLLYLWQIAHPSEWLPEASNATDDSHQAYNTLSDLRPFNATPEGMRNIRELGYLYPESALAAGNMTTTEILASLTSVYNCKPANRQMVYAKIIARLDGFGSVRVVVGVLRNSNPTISQSTNNPIFLSSMKPQRASRVVHAVDITDAVKSSRFNFHIPEDIHFGAGSDFNVTVAVYSCSSNLEISLREAGLELIQIFHAPEGPFGVKHLLCQRNVSSACQHDYDCAPCETCHPTERSCTAIAASGVDQSRRSTCRKTCRSDRDCHCPLIGADTAMCNYCIDHLCTRE